MTQKIEIKNRWSGNVLFSYECEDNTIKKTVLEAIKEGANLEDANLVGANLVGAYLGDANLGDANLRGANLRGAYLVGANLRDANLEGANLEDANLEDANLVGANLVGANLEDANLEDANLRDANLRDANLRGANLEDANLRDAYLVGANLRGANLRGANLVGAYLGDANLGDANLRGANLGDANYNEYTAFFALQCPEEGEFIAWKKVKCHIVKLLIPADAQRSSATNRKCRASKAHVLAIYDKDGNAKESVVSDSHVPTTYNVGEDVLPDSWDEDRWNECSHGIHFFITRREAELYN